jgi:outer membrane protein
MTNLFRLRLNSVEALRAAEAVGDISGRKRTTTPHKGDSMKHFVRVILGLFLIFFFSTHTLAAGPSKVGVVDMKKFQQASTAFREIRTQIKKKHDALQKRLDEEKNALAKLEEDLRKQGMMLSLDAQEDKQLEVEKKKRYVKYLYEDFSFEMKAAETETTGRLVKDLETIVSKIGEQEGFTVIFEKRAIGLIYSDKTIDITDRVIEAYDKSKR